MVTASKKIVPRSVDRSSYLRPNEHARSRFHHVAGKTSRRGLEQESDSCADTAQGRWKGGRGRRPPPLLLLLLLPSAAAVAVAEVASAAITASINIRKVGITSTGYRDIFSVLR
jgi:hypothetical protein